MTLECRVVKSEVFLTGSIDEHSSLEKVFAQLAKTRDDPLVVNLQGVLRINSIGVRRWIPLMAALAKSRRVTVSALSYPLVMQANMLVNLMAGAKVVSCMAPYFCGMCQANRMVLVAAHEVRRNEPAPSRGCPECGQPMEFDELDNYFAFFSRQS